MQHPKHDEDFTFLFRQEQGVPQEESREIYGYLYVLEDEFH